MYCFIPDFNTALGYHNQEIHVLFSIICIANTIRGTEEEAGAGTVTAVGTHKGAAAGAGRAEQ